MNKSLSAYVLIVIFCFGVFASQSHVQAGEILFVSPTRVSLSDENMVTTVNVTNLSNVTRHYSLNLEDIIMTPQGVTAEVDNFEFSAKRMLRYVPRQVVLEPGKRQTVRIMARINPDTPPGDYHSHLHFLEDATKRGKSPDKENQDSLGGAQPAAPLTYSALIPLILRVGNVSTDVGINEIKLSRDQNNNIIVKSVITRAGNGQGTAYFATTFVNPDGTEITATPNRTAYIYRELSERLHSYNFAQPQNLDPASKLKIKVFDGVSADAKQVHEAILSLP